VAAACWRASDHDLTGGDGVDTDALLAGIVVLSVLGLTAAGLIGALGRMLLRWR